MHTTYARLPKVRKRTREKRKHDEIPCMTNLDVPTMHFSISLNFQRILQFHPTVMSVAYVDYSFIIFHQNVFPVSFIVESIEILVWSRGDFTIGRFVSPKQQTSRMRSKG
jgi:hypothetical protein